MTRTTIQLLRRIMTRMTKSHAKRIRLLRCADQTSELMTRATRRNISPVCLRAWGVTNKTRDVSVRARGDREPDTTTISAMTIGTSSFTVFRVIEARVETAQRWKRLDLSALRVRVTDRADLARRIRKLLRVTTRARRVCSFTRQCRLR